MWMERMIPFDSRRPQVALTSPNELQRIYKSWDIYMTNVQKGVPTEKQSGMFPFDGRSLLSMLSNLI